MLNPYEPPLEGARPGERPTWTRYFVLACFALVAAIAYIQRNGLGVAAPIVQQDLSIDKQQMGWVMGVFFVTYGVVQVPAGWLAFRWGTRRTLTMLAVLWSLSTALIGLAPSFAALLAAQLLMGAAQAGVFPCAVSSLARWLPPTRRGLAGGTLASTMSAGSAAGVALMGLLIAYLSWRWIFRLYCLPGLLWALAFALWFRNDPSEHRRVNAAELAIIREGVPGPSPAEPRKEPVPWGAILSSRAMWFICGQHIFRAAGYIFYATWFPTFLREVHGVSISNSGLLAGIPLAMIIIGSPPGGVVSDFVLARTGSRRLGRQVFAATCMVLCALLILTAWRMPSAVLAVILFATSSFCHAFGGPCAYAITMDMGGKHVSTVFSLMNAVGSLGAFAFPVVIPWIVDLGGWNLVMVTFAGIYIAAALCWLAFDPNGTIADTAPTEAPT